ncbi:MAG: hypothetical protein CMN04_02145 [Roseibacillus sp.]|mgnify:FL=1|nr:hypothetical protein [Roseibacillus sp.]|tara:strand:+ start:20100 stop:20828 length:729 start_codon:yes stop_codon:yes gene_type:complete
MGEVGYVVKFEVKIDRFAVLDEESDLPQKSPVSRTLLMLLIVALLGGGGVSAKPENTEKVPKEVLDQAVDATRVMGQQVLKGDYSVALDRMYPRWKNRAAKRLAGGQAELARRLADIPAKMASQGISMLKYEVGEPTGAHEVVLLRGKDRSGNDVNMYLEWLVFVPTRAEYRIIDPQTRLARRIETTGFQVAVNRKGTADWYFIDGRNCSIADLRSFFPGLPEDLGLLGIPKVGGGELGRGR